MTALAPASFLIPLKPAKTNGLAELGVPLSDATLVKKGKLGEGMQMLEGAEPARIGRRFQNLKATLVRAAEGGQAGAKLILSFEVFGDDNAPLGAPSGVSVRLMAGDRLIAEQALGALFLPYGSCWYENRFATNVSLDACEALDGVVIVAAADDVRQL